MVQIDDRQRRDAPGSARAVEQRNPANGRHDQQGNRCLVINFLCLNCHVDFQLNLKHG